MIKEDKNYIYIDEISDLNNENILKCSILGSTSEIYKFKNNQILKIFNESHSISNLNTLEIIRNLNLKSFICPNKFIFLNEQYYGYSMDYFKGNILVELNENTNYNNILNNLNVIEKDIYELSNNNIEICDLNFLNILYNYKNNILKIIDLDEYEKSNKSIEEILLFNKEEFILEFFLSLSDCYNKNINKETLNKLRNYILNKNMNVSFYELFYELKHYIENIFNKEITTLSDYRKILKIN